MKYTEMKIGRVFSIRLEDSDKLPDCVEDLAAEENINRGICWFLGGIKKDSTIVAGPEDGEKLPPLPMELKISGTRETLGIATLFPDEQGRPVLHGHASFGREESSLTGCIRPGIEVWHVLEVVLLELLGDKGRRVKDSNTGFTLYDPEK